MRQKTRRKLAQKVWEKTREQLSKPLGEKLQKATGVEAVDRMMHGRDVIAHFQHTNALPLEKELQPAKLVPELVANNVSDEKQEVDKARIAINQYLQEPDFATAYNLLVTARRINTVALRELEEMLAAKADVPTLARDVLVGAADFGARKEFNEDALMQKEIIPLHRVLGAIVDRHRAADEKAAREAEQKVAEERRVAKLPIGFIHHAELTEPTLDKVQPLVLTGWQPALSWLFDKIVSILTADERNFTVLRFIPGRTKHLPSTPRLINVTGEEWRGCCNSKHDFVRCLHELVAPQVGHTMPDLVLVDDLAFSLTSGYAGRHPGAVAGDASRRWFKFCQEFGCALIGGVPWPEPAEPDTKGPAYEQLRTAAHLRPVRVTQTDALVQLGLPHAAALFEVAAADIDAYQVARVVVP